LARFLHDDWGFEVQLSEDPLSPFRVDPRDDSIESCLANVRASDVVVCIVDRRYGGVLKHGDYAGKSATEIEVEHARSLDPPRPVFFFVRDAAFQDLQTLRRNGRAKTKWVEPGKKKRDQRKRWFEWVARVSNLPEHESRNNWCDQFKTVAELKALVLKRLLDQFPTQAASLAMQPGRLVRIHFLWRFDASPHHISGRFENVGVGPAMNIEHGRSSAGILQTEPAPVKTAFHRGGLREGDSIVEEKLDIYRYDVGIAARTFCYCTYQNRFGDWYHVAAEFTRSTTDEPFRDHPFERFFVQAGDGRWVEMPSGQG
jgi:hypothetical protein